MRGQLKGTHEDTNLEEYYEIPKTVRRQNSIRRLAVPKHINKGYVGKDGRLNYLENKYLLTLWKLFREVDRSGDGAISLKEMQTNHTFKSFLTSEEIADVYKDYDTDFSGKVNWMEFCHMMCPPG